MRYNVNDYNIFLFTVVTPNHQVCGIAIPVCVGALCPFAMLVSGVTQDWLIVFLLEALVTIMIKIIST